MRPGIWQILIVVLIIVLIFGATKLPSLAKNLGKSMKIFRDEVKDLGKDDKESSDDEKAPGKPEVTAESGENPPSAKDVNDVDKSQHSN